MISEQHEKILATTVIGSFSTLRKKDGRISTNPVSFSMPAALMRSKRFCFGLIGPTASSSMRPTASFIEVRGVLSSWETRAMKSAFMSSSFLSW